MSPFPAAIPDFAWTRLPAAGFGVPVFRFQAPAPARLEPDLDFLAETGYRTLRAEEILALLRGEIEPPPRGLVLSFDGGPLETLAAAGAALRRRGLCALAFLSPRGFVERRGESEPERPTWAELDALVSGGAFEAAAHSEDAGFVFTGDRILDFQHPGARGRPRYPWLWTAYDALPHDPLWGAPVYPWARPLGARAWIPPPGLAERCRRFVAIRGERGFLADVTWREELTRFAAAIRIEHGAGRHETPSEGRERRLRSLRAAREALAARYPGSGSLIALTPGPLLEDTRDCLHAAGYEAAFSRLTAIGRLRPGLDPFDLPRIDGRWLRWVPGGRPPGRLTALRRWLAG